MRTLSNQPTPREEDGPDKAETVVGNLAIVEDGTRVPPFLLPDHRSGTARRHDPATKRPLANSYRSKKREGWAVVLQRPSFLAKGQTMQIPEGTRAVFRAGADSGVEVTVLAGDDEAGGRSLTGSVVASFAQA